MKLSCGKLQYWIWKKSPVGAGTFCPSPMLAFYIPQCRKCLPAWQTVKYSLGEGPDVPAPTGGFSIPRTAIFPEESFVVYILYQGNHGLQDRTGQVYYS
jgi:hypothetical protein